MSHENITFNDNGTVSTIPHHPLEWREELSGSRSEDDMLYLPNIALLVSWIVNFEFPRIVTWNFKQRTFSCKLWAMRLRYVCSTEGTDTLKNQNWWHLSGRVTLSESLFGNLPTIVGNSDFLTWLFWSDFSFEVTLPSTAIKSLKKIERNF